MTIIKSQHWRKARLRNTRPQVIVVMPAYNAAATLEATYHAIDTGCVDEIILVDDESQDETAAIAEKLSLRVVRHRRNLGYGGNQKTCYTEALREDFLQKSTIQHLSRR